MNKILRSPGQYIQGRKALSGLSQLIRCMGEKPLVIMGPIVYKKLSCTIKDVLKDYDAAYEIFTGEVCMAELNRMLASMDSNKCDIVIGVGGGTTIDLAKATAFKAAAPLVIVPSSVSTDAPCSAISILYKENGEFDRYFHLDRNPDIVLVDTEIIMDAPAAQFVAGMGDAMSTYFEARACRRSGALNPSNGFPTVSGYNTAKLCWDNLKQYGRAALRSLRAKEYSEAFDIIIETNTYLSSVGFESGGLAGAHGIQKGLLQIPECADQPHGMLVAYCTQVQLVLENSQDDLKEVRSFCKDVGLPLCLEDLGYNKIQHADLLRAAEFCMRENNTIHNMPIKITTNSIINSILQADFEGRAYKGSTTSL